MRGTENVSGFYHQQGTLFELIKISAQLDARVDAVVLSIF
jgi:hypothetical protein